MPEVRDLRGMWLSVCAEGARNHEVLTPMPRKWTETRCRQVRKVDEYLEGEWGPLVEAVRTATTWGAGSPLDLSLERLTTKECERLDSLLSGKWRATAGSGASSRREALERERQAILSRPGSTSDAGEARLRQIRYELERVR